MISCFSNEEMNKRQGEVKKKDTKKQIKYKPPAKWANVHGCCCTCAEEVWKPTFFFTLCGMLLALAQHRGASLALREAWSRRARRFGPSTSGGSAARPQRGCWRGSAGMAASCWGTATRCRASTVCVWGERPKFLIIVLPEHFACVVDDELLRWRRLNPRLQSVQQQINQLQLFHFCFLAVKNCFRTVSRSHFFLMKRKVWASPVCATQPSK